MVGNATFFGGRDWLYIYHEIKKEGKLRRGGMRIFVGRFSGRILSGVPYRKVGIARTLGARKWIWKKGIKGIGGFGGYRF
jgi:hypothetical protein